MDENEYWLKFWVLFTIAFLSIVGSVYYSIKHRYTLQMESWNTCVEAGGQPISQPMLGTQTLTFTCLRK